MGLRDGRTDGRNMGYSSRRTKSPRVFIGRLEGDPSAHGLGYVDIKSVSFGGYLETKLSQHTPVRKQMGHPVPGVCVVFHRFSVLAAVLYITGLDENFCPVLGNWSGGAQHTVSSHVPQ